MNGVFSKDALKPYYMYKIGIYSILIIALLIGGIFSYVVERNHIYEVRERKLEIVSDYVAKRIDRWMLERLADANALSSNTNLIKSIKTILKDSNPVDESFISSRFLSYIKIKGYEAVYLIDNQGKLVLSQPSDLDTLEISFVEAARVSFNSDTSIWSSKEYCPIHNRIHWDVHVPIFDDYDHKKNPIAIMGFRANTQEFLKESIANIPIKSPSLECFIAEHSGDSLRILSPMKRLAGQSITPKMPIPGGLRVLSKARQEGFVLGKTESFDGLPALVSVQALHHKDWYLFMIENESDVLAPLKKHVLTIFLIVLLIMGLSFTFLNIIISKLRNKRLQEMYLEQADKQALLQHYAYIVQYANDIIYLCDENDRIIQYNKSALVFYGYTEEEFDRLQAVKLIDKQTYAQHKELYTYDDYVHGMILETIHVKKDGTKVDVEASIRAIETGNAKYFQCIIRDISDRKHAQATSARLHKEIRELNQELESRVKDRTRQLMQAYKDMESFSYSVSHDLKAPLRSVLGFSEALKEDLGDDLSPALQDHIHRIQSGCNNMNEIIDSLMELSKVSSSPLSFEDVNLSQLIEAQYRELTQTMDDSEISLSVLPHIYVYGDATLLKLAIRNILSNAIKFSSLVSKPFIEVTYSDEDIYRVIEIKDNGIGFDMKYADRLFVPFQRLHSEPQFKGTGIGLSIVKRVMQKHDADVSVQSVKSVGTTIILRFKFQQGEIFSLQDNDNG